MGQIYNEQELKDLRNNIDKSKRANYYELKGFTYKQFYDHSTDVYNPFKVYVYKDNGYVMGGVGPTIEAAYHNLILSSIEYMEKYKQERNELINKVAKVNSILNPDKDEDENDL